MNKLEIFNNSRHQLFSLSYRMLGSVADAEDLVQETYIRWEKIDVQSIEYPKAYLMKTITNLCLNHLKSARVAREEYIGPWLPEPLISEVKGGVEEDLGFEDSLSMAFLLMLERLNPAERAAFLLREVFGFEYKEIAEIIDKNKTNCRKLVSRAKQNIKKKKKHEVVSKNKQMEILQRFMHACKSGELEGLVKLLAKDVVFYSDGGGKVLAARKPILGDDNVARFLIGIITKFTSENLDVRIRSVNGKVGLTNFVEGEMVSVLSLDSDGENITAIYSVVNPDKLQS